MNSKISVKKIIIIAAAVIILAAVVILAIRLPVYLSLRQPFSHIIKGFEEADSHELLEALPSAVVESLELSDEDYEEIDEMLESGGDDVLGEFLNDDDYKLKVDMLGYKKLDSGQIDLLNDVYSEIGVDIEIKKAYHTDFKLRVKSSEDDLSLTYGMTVGKVDGEWCIVGGDSFSNAVLLPSILNYVRKSELKSANADAKTAYSAVAAYVADRETAGQSFETTISEFSLVIDLAGEPPVGDGPRLVYDALNYTNGEVRVFCDYLSNGEYTFIVQYRGDNGMIGQYPDPVQWEDYKMEKIVWGEYFEPSY